MKRTRTIVALVFAIGASSILFQNCGKYRATHLTSNASLSGQPAPLVLDPNLELNANVQDANQIQSQNATIPVVLNKADADPIVISYQTSDGTAKAGINYQQVTSSVTVPAGETSVKVMVPVIVSDSVSDLNFNFTITAVSKGTIGRAAGKFYLVKNAVVKPKWHLYRPANAPVGVSMSFSTWTGTKLLRFYESDANNVRSQKGFLLDPVTGLATLMTDSPLSLRTGNMAWAGNKMIQWGGNYSASGTDVGRIDHNDGAMYDPATNTWTAMNATGAPAGRGEFIDMKVAGSKVVIFGGLSIQNGRRLPTPDGGVFDTATNTWVVMPAMQGRVNAKSDIGGNKVYIWGGEFWTPGAGASITYSLPTAGVIYDLATNTVTATATAGAPAGRIAPTVKWTGSKLLVLGGVSGTVALTDGGMYDPVTGTWTAMNMTGAPTPELTNSGYANVEFIDGKLYVFGSLSAASSGVFDPVQNRWSALNLTGAPTTRINFGKVQTGSKFYVFGGQTAANGAGLPGGAVFDATTGMWMTLEPVGAPSARVGSYLYWTGSGLGVVDGSGIDPADGGLLY